MDYNPGLPVELATDGLGLAFGGQVFAPPAEVRLLRDVRPALRDPSADGPEILYAIYMDVGLDEDRAALLEQNLLFGAVVFNAGRVGNEPVRSQGHVHAVSASCGQSTGELYEFWHGAGCVYMQEHDGDDPGRCVAVHATPGEKVYVPPGWAHMTINTHRTSPMAFGAWCVRDYGFDYAGVRRHGGLAWFPVLDGDALGWERNPAYRDAELVETTPPDLSGIGVAPDRPIYLQWRERPADFDFIPRPSALTAAGCPDPPGVP